MIRLGLRLAGRGHGAFARLALMAGAIALGVALVVVLAGGIVASVRRAERVNDRSVPDAAFVCCSPYVLPVDDSSLLWSLQRTRIPGSRTVTTIGVAALSDHPPIPPGTRRVPAPGTLLVSPELARAIEAGTVTAPTGRIVGTLGQEMLGRPGDLVAMRGWAPDRLRALDPGVRQVFEFPQRADVASSDRLFAGTANWRSIVIGVPFVLIGASILLLPVLVLVGAGARVGSRRRAGRLAALRLAGATPGEIRVLAAVEAGVAGFAGSALGLLLALVARQLTIQRGAFFASDLTLPWLWVVLIVVMATLLAAVSATLALGRVARKPLARARDVPEPVRARRWWLFGAAWTVFLAGIALFGQQDFSRSVAGWTIAIGFVGIVGSLVVCGPELVQRLAGALASSSGRPATLLAARRLQAQPRLGFRAVLGVLLALFVATLLLVFIPSLEAGNRARRTSTPPSRETVLRSDLVATSDRSSGFETLNGATLPAGGPSVAVADEVASLQGVRRVVPVVAADVQIAATPGAAFGSTGSYSFRIGVITATCREFAAVTRTRAAGCRPGVLVAPSIAPLDLGASTSVVFPLVERVGVTVPVPELTPFEPLAAVPDGSVALAPPRLLPPDVLASGRLEGLYLATDGRPETARRVAALLAATAPGMDLVPGGEQTEYLSPVRTGVWLLPLLAYVLVLAACALCIVTVDGVFERRRSLAALRAAGAQPAVLRGATMIEIAGPLLVVAVLGSATGVATGTAFVVMRGAPFAPAWWGLAITAGLLAGIWLVVTALSLPAVTRASALAELRAT